MADVRRACPHSTGSAGDPADWPQRRGGPAEGDGGEAAESAGDGGSAPRIDRPLAAGGGTAREHFRRAASARSARRCWRSPSCSPGASARPPTWWARRCTPSATGATAAAHCGPRAPPRWCGRPCSTAFSARARSGCGTAGRCSATSGPRRAASGSSTRSAWNCWASPMPADDVEAIAIAWDLLEDLGVWGPWPWSSTPRRAGGSGPLPHRAGGLAGSPREELDPDSQARVHTNPLRVLDSKHPATQALLAGAPALADALSGESHERFSEVRQGLETLGIPSGSIRGWCAASTTTATPPSRSPAPSSGPGHRCAAAAATTGWWSSSAVPPRPRSAGALGLERLCCCSSRRGGRRTPPPLRRCTW